MQYVTTGNDTITYSPEYVIQSFCNNEDGYFIPLHIPQIDQKVILESSANDTVAHVLNLFFTLELTGRDVDLAIGKYPIRLNHMNHRISVIESWHNLDRRFDRLVKNLTARIRGSKDTEMPYNPWLSVAVKAAVICGAYTQAVTQMVIVPDDAFDICVPSNDFSCAISAWFCRKMGLPIRNIVICCNENNNLWELLNHGELRTGRSVIQTRLSLCDQTVPPLLEMLIYSCGSVQEVQVFRKCRLESRTYFPCDDVAVKISEGFHVSVIGQSRTDSTIPGAYHTHGYIMGPYTALTYAGALDYRAGTGENRHIMLFSEYSPSLHKEYIADSLATTVEEVHQLLDA